MTDFLFSLPDESFSPSPGDQREVPYLPPPRLIRTAHIRLVGPERFLAISDYGFPPPYKILDVRRKLLASQSLFTAIPPQWPGPSAKHPLPPLYVNCRFFP